VILTKHETEWLAKESIEEQDASVSIALVSAARRAPLCAEFRTGLCILRWNDEWHGNWTGEYATPMLLSRH